MPWFCEDIPFDQIVASIADRARADQSGHPGNHNDLEEEREKGERGELNAIIHSGCCMRGACRN